MGHAESFLKEAAGIALAVSHDRLEEIAGHLADTRDIGGRVFIVGFGGSSANAIHMAADLRKLCRIDAYAMDNIAELTARANDEGLETVFLEWLDVSNMNHKDALFVLSVGGGTKGVSEAIVKAVDFAQDMGAQVLGIVGPDGGYTAKHGQAVVLVPAKSITPQTEAFQAVIWHCLVSHPLLQKTKTKW